MNTFQLIVLPILGLLILERLRALAHSRQPFGVTLMGLGVWVAGFIAVLWPRLTAVIADGLGIERGADLVSYVSILAMFGGFFLLYARLRRQDTALTRLVRQIAIENPQAPV